MPCCFIYIFHPRVFEISEEYGESPPVSPSGAALFSVQFSVQAGGIEANRWVDGGSVATVVAKSMGYANLQNYGL